MQISKKRQFLIVLGAFLALGIPFKVMVLVEGLTEVRPVNALPPVAGLVAGPVGALACGIGNMLADLFGSFNMTSLLGLVANFIAAYLPYRLWHLFSKEEPNLHTTKNILLYAVICLTTAWTVAWILGFGLRFFFGMWVEQIYTYVFFNNIGFSIGLGMPLLIILTSDSIRMACTPRPKKYLVLGNTKLRNLVCGSFMVLMAVICVCVVVLHKSPDDLPWLWALSAVSAAGLVCQII